MQSNCATQQAYRATLLLASHSLDGGRCCAIAVGQVKVCQHDVARVVQQDVFRLQIPVDKA